MKANLVKTLIIAVCALVILALPLFFVSLFNVRVDPVLLRTLIIIVVAFVLAGSIMLYLSLNRMDRATPAVEPEPLAGLKGKVTTSLSPEGRVRVANEDWKAVTSDGTIAVGENVEVVERRGIMLVVKRPSGPTSA